MLEKLWLNLFLCVYIFIAKCESFKRNTARCNYVGSKDRARKQTGDEEQYMYIVDSDYNSDIHLPVMEPLV